MPLSGTSQPIPESTEEIYYRSEMPETGDPLKKSVDSLGQSLSLRKRANSFKTYIKKPTVVVKKNTEGEDDTQLGYGSLGLPPNTFSDSPKSAHIIENEKSTPFFSFTHKNRSSSTKKYDNESCSDEEGLDHKWSLSSSLSASFNKSPIPFHHGQRSREGSNEPIVRRSTLSKGHPEPDLPSRKTNNSLIHRLFHNSHHGDSDEKVNNSHSTSTENAALENADSPFSPSRTEAEHNSPFYTGDHMNNSQSNSPHHPRQSSTSSKISKIFHFRTSFHFSSGTTTPHRSASNSVEKLDKIHPDGHAEVEPTPIHSENTTPSKFHVFKSHKFHQEDSFNLVKDLFSNLQYKRSGSASSLNGENGLLSNSASNTPTKALQNSVSREFYGKGDQVLGKGANAVVKLTHQKFANMSSEKLYAVKEFRKKRKEEQSRDYVKKLMGEFCISSSLHHENIIETIDLLHDENDRWCEVMEYVSGGDLYGRISKGNLLEHNEINCYYRQLINGVSYLHGMGVAHRDLKPENILLDETWRILKITDFGCSEVFQTVFESTARKAKGIHGSDPYIAPEEFEDGIEYAAANVDIWACGIILFTMYQKTVPWHWAKNEDDHHYTEYLKRRQPEGYGYSKFDKLPDGPRQMIYLTLEPDPKKRLDTKQIKETNAWFKSIEYCHHEHPSSLNLPNFPKNLSSELKSKTTGEILEKMIKESPTQISINEIEERIHLSNNSSDDCIDLNVQKSESKPPIRKMFEIFDENDPTENDPTSPSSPISPTSSTYLENVEGKLPPLSSTRASGVNAVCDHPVLNQVRHRHSRPE